MEFYILQKLSTSGETQALSAYTQRQFLKFNSLVMTTESKLFPPLDFLYIIPPGFEGREHWGPVVI